MCLIYKPTSSWRVLVWYGGCPKQFSHLKKFRAVTDPSEVFCKGEIIQGRKMPSGLTVIGQSCSIRKEGVMGDSASAPRLINIPYVHTVIQSIYETFDL